jgi:hypothetical protein
MSPFAFAKASIQAKRWRLKLIQRARLEGTAPLDLLDEQLLEPESPDLSNDWSEVLQKARRAESSIAQSIG